MIITVNVKWTIIALSLFLGSFLGSFFYSAYSGLGGRVSTLELVMETVAESSLISLQTALELEKKGIISHNNFVDFQEYAEFDPNEIIKNYFSRE